MSEIAGALPVEGRSTGCRRQPVASPASSYVRLAGAHVVQVSLRDGFLVLERGFLADDGFRSDGSARFVVRADRAEDLRLAIREVS